MRGWIVAACLFWCVAANAAEVVRVPLMDGVYSVASPDDWWLEEEADGSAVTFAPTANSPTQVIFSAPNTKVDGDHADYANLQMGMIFAMLDGGEITSEEDTTFSGRPCQTFAFTVPFGPGHIEGIGRAIDVGGAVAMMLALSPDDLAEEFLPRAREIMDTFELDQEAFENNRARLDELSERVNAELESARAMLAQ
ncbi:MAG: hypothetical protein LUC93_18620 [Planctomycetaceae bacterium]|nr:hypothetical protein [Planctomycetaceae bacterium]